MEQAKIKERLSYLLARICHAHRNLVHGELSKLNLHVGQEMFLLRLWEQDGITLSEMAEGLCVQQATVTRMLGRIESAGLVTRLNDPDDQRVSRVYLTEKGGNLLQPVAQMWAEVETRLLTNFTLEERLLLRRLLLQLYSNLTD
jgi:DNA-binding MarR family transcriptional regulator